MNLLIIDDGKICTFINNRVGASAGFFQDIYCVSNSKEAIAHLKQVSMGMLGTPDLILLNLNMPVMNGVSFVKALQTLSSPGKDVVAIVNLTSSADSSDLQEARRAVINQYLVRPLTLNNLPSTVLCLDQTLWKTSLTGTAARQTISA